MEMNPYAAPQSQVLYTTASDDEAIRTQHLSTEATIKSVGTLYYLGAFILTLLGLFWIGTGIMRGEDAVAASLLLGGITLVFGIAEGVLAHGLRTLKSWARIPTIILSSIGLLGFPLGTLISIYILVKVGGKQGKFILSPEYQRIIAATPHVKYKTSKVIWVILIVLVIVLIGIGFVSSLRH